MRTKIAIFMNLYLSTFLCNTQGNITLNPQNLEKRTDPEKPTSTGALLHEMRRVRVRGALPRTSATTPMRQRNNFAYAEAPVRRRRSTSAASSRRQCGDAEEIARQFRGVSVSMSRRHRRAAGGSSRRRPFASTSTLLVPESAVFCAARLRMKTSARTSPGRALRPVAANPDHAHYRETRSEARAMHSSGRAIWDLVGASL
jgi:hypothetical protein